MARRKNTIAEATVVEEVKKTSRSKKTTDETTEVKKASVKKVKKENEEKAAPKVKHIPVKRGKVDYVPGEAVQKLLDQGVTVNDKENDNPLFELPKKQVDMSTDNIEIKDKKEVRVIIDTYYQSQRRRIGAENQERSVLQAADDGEIDQEVTSIDTDDIRYPALAYIVDNRINEEKELAKLVTRYVETTPVGRWMTANIGVGPLIAGSFLAYFDVSKAKYAGNFWSYCGYNDNNDPWLSSDDVDYIMKNIVGNNKIDEELFGKISAYSGRAASRIAAGSVDKNGNITKESLKKYLKKPPFNRNLKIACWKLGQSFLKVKNKPESKYGRLLKERELYELTCNENGEYIQEALKALGYIFKKDRNATKEQNLALLEQCKKDIEEGKFKPAYKKDTIPYQAYIQGKLPKTHIMSRCLRWTVKLFLSHLHECMYMDYYGEECPAPYVINVAGHTRRIAPEVPYEEFINVPKGYNPHYDA